MSDLQKTRAGERLAISARDYNAFIDAARDHRARSINRRQTNTPSPMQASVILVRNDSDADQPQLAVLGIDAPIITPDVNEDEFKRRVALSCVTPALDAHSGRFVILAEPLAIGAIGRAYAAGICPVKLNVPDDDNEYHTAEVSDGSAEHLAAVGNGSARILWHEGEAGEQWAIVHLGAQAPRAGVFPVRLFQVGGESGNAESPASWTYDVLDAVTEEQLAEDVDPAAAPHKWQRPSVGYMIEATFGYAHYQEDAEGEPQLVLGWINEVAEQAQCF